MASKSRSVPPRRRVRHVYRRPNLFPVVIIAMQLMIFIDQWQGDTLVTVISDGEQSMEHILKR